MILKNKKVTVVGLGKSGFGAAKFLLGRKALVRVTEYSSSKEALEAAGYLRSLGVPVETGGHTEAFVMGSDLLVTSPGVPKTSLPLAYAKKENIPIISEVELASIFCPGKIIGITGSNGKTTTGNLIHLILEAGLNPSVLCGNVGYSFINAILEMNKNTTAVLELSSFQLEDSPNFRPDIAVVLNVSPNHLDRHGSMENYIAAKEKIFASQKKTDWLVLNYENLATRKMAKKAHSKVLFFSKKPINEGIFLKDRKIISRRDGHDRVVAELKDLKLRGEHNLENILAAAAVASILKINSVSLEKVLSSFQTLDHRIQPLGTIAGVYFVNDSKSTTIDSTRAAISSVDTPIVLIAGGRDKGSEFSTIEKILEAKVKHVVLYGQSRDKIASQWKNFKRFETVERFSQAVQAAFRKAQVGDTILLSPMCTSFDQFSSYEERGEAFKNIFLQMKNESPLSATWNP